MKKVLAVASVSVALLFGSVSTAFASPAAHVVLEKSNMPTWVVELIVPLIHR